MTNEAQKPAEAKDAAAKPKAPEKAESKAAAKPKAYTSTSPVYTGGRYYKPGEAFVTDAKKGEDWTAIDEADKAAIDASQPLGAGDPSLEALDLKALQAIAAEKKVNADGLSRADLITAIKAANEPRL